MLLSSGAFEPMPIAIHRRNRDAWNLKDRKPKHNSTKLCMCVKGRKNVNIMLVFFCCLFLTSRFMMSVFKNGFHFVWMCLLLNGSRLYVTIQKHILNKVSPFVDLFLLFIYWYIHPLRIDRDSQGFYLLAFVCVWVFVFKNVFLFFFSFDRVHEYNVSLNYCE